MKSSNLFVDMMSSIDEFKMRVLEESLPVDTMTSLQCSCDFTIQRRSDVAIQQRWKRRTTLKKRRRCNVLLSDVVTRRCNDVVFATSSDVSNATIWQLQSDVAQRRPNDVVKLLCLMESKYRYRNCVIISINSLYPEIILQLIEYFQ